MEFDLKPLLHCLPFNHGRDTFRRGDFGKRHQGFGPVECGHAVEDRSPAVDARGSCKGVASGEPADPLAAPDVPLMVSPRDNSSVQTNLDSPSGRSFAQIADSELVADVGYRGD